MALERIEDNKESYCDSGTSEENCSSIIIKLKGTSEELAALRSSSSICFSSSILSKLRRIISSLRSLRTLRKRLNRSIRAIASRITLKDF